MNVQHVRILIILKEKMKLGGQEMPIIVCGKCEKVLFMSKKKWGDELYSYSCTNCGFPGFYGWRSVYSNLFELIRSFLRGYKK
jgi:hypothetical protein